MSVLADVQIAKLALERLMIEPFIDQPVRGKAASYGLSSYGYDVRIANEFKVFTDVYTSVIDPANIDNRSFVDIVEDNVLIMPPHSFVLGRSVEYFRLPRDVLAICVGKSTYARCGLIVNVTPLEPEWEGHITIEISNTTPLPAKVYVGEGICQVIFLQAESTCEVSYLDKAGKYQGQIGVTLPRA